MKRFAFAVKFVLFFFMFQTTATAWAWELQPNGAGVRMTWGGEKIAKRQIQIIEAESYDRSREFSTSMAYRPERPLVSKERFLADLEAGKLLATPEQFRQTLAYSGISTTDVLGYLRGLEWRKNEVQAPARMARLLHNYSTKRSRVDYGLVRNLEVGEFALWDGNRPIIAGDCGNVIVGIVGQRQEQQERKAVVEYSQTPPPPPVIVEKPVAESATSKESWWSKNWPWIVGALVVIGGIVALSGGHGGGSNPPLGPSPPPPGNN